MTLVSHIDSMLLLIDDEEKRIRNLRHLPFIVLNIEILRLLHQLFHSRFTEELDEWLILRKSLVAAEQEFCSLVLLAFSNSLLRIVQCLGDESALAAVQLLDIRSEYLVLFIVLGLGHRT